MDSAILTVITFHASSTGEIAYSVLLNASQLGSVTANVTINATHPLVTMIKETARNVQKTVYSPLKETKSATKLAITSHVNMMVVTASNVQTDVRNQ
jgi:hypothetical protein